jgi:maltose-binding protein MalE
MMSNTSRRHFIRNSSVAAAAVGAAAVIPATTAHAAEPEETGAMHDGHFTVWVRNAKTGEIVVQAGEKEISHRDPKLAAKLARIAAKGAAS